MLKYLIVAASLLGLVSCVTANEALIPQPGQDTISINAGPCSGTCPIYELMISSDGLVSFQAGHEGYGGRDRTNFRQVRAIKVVPEQFEAVAKALEPYRPPNAVPACSELTTSAEIYTIVWTDRTGATATLGHYGGFTCPESEELTRVILAIPAMLGIADWVTQTSEPRSSERRQRSAQHRVP
jgi:hypothetical protein